jgi:hypothetical protein
MKPEYIGLLGTVIGSMITLAGVFVNNFYHSLKEKKKFKRDMLEEIHKTANLMFSILENGVENPNATWPPQAHAGRSLYEQKYIKEYKDAFENTKEKFLMLVNFYFENLVPQANKFAELCDKYVKKQTENRMTTKLLEELEKDLKEIETNKDYFLKAVYAEVVKTI